MNFDEFKKQLMQDIPDQINSDAKIIVAENNVDKLQNESYQGIVVRKEGEQIGVTLNVSALPSEETSQVGLIINKGACMGCTLCTKNYPELFEIKSKKAVIKAHDATTIDKEKLQTTINACPVKAIEYIED